MRKSFVLALLLCLYLLVILPHGAHAQQPVVYGVLFYSQSCSHCHYVITEVLPPLEEEFGEQLEILYVDVSQPEGGGWFRAAFDAADIPDDRRGYVPTMVIGTTALIGGRDIPEQMPGLIEEGLAAGGIDLPPIPGLREAYEATVATQQASNAGEDPPESAPISTTYQKTTWRDRLAQDSLGNSFALGVLVILMIGLAGQVSHGTRLFDEVGKRDWNTGHAGRIFILGVATLTTFIAGTLAFEGGSITLPTVLAAGVTAGMIPVVWTLGRVEFRAGATYRVPGWLVPWVAVLGLAVAGYLAYVEIGGNEAVCGAVGDCNTVQQSEYAKLFGLIPIGALGVFGYTLILGTWLIGCCRNDGMADTANSLLLGLALFGTVFSIYLTFLEPFVIGATCAWCLTSAMMMILILSLHGPDGWTAVNRLADRLARRPYRSNQPDW